MGNVGPMPKPLRIWLVAFTSPHSRARGTCRRPPRPCTRPHGTSPAGGLVVWTIHLRGKAVSDVRSRRAAVLGRSRTFAPRAPSATTTRPLQRGCARVRGASFDRSALSAVSVHYVDDVRRPGIGGSARLGHATSIPSLGDRTSPTADGCRRRTREPTVRAFDVEPSKRWAGSMLYGSAPYPWYHGAGRRRRPGAVRDASQILTMTGLGMLRAMLQVRLE